MKENQMEHDDLTKITGIGEAWQQWLADEFSVRTYDELAALSVDEINLSLKSKKNPPDINKVKLWIKEAEKLAVEQTNSPNILDSDSLIVQDSKTPRNGISTKIGKESKSHEKPWTTMAMFSVEFQTRRTENRNYEQQTKVKDHKTEVEHLWPGIEVGQIGPWMIEQAGDKLQQEIKGMPKFEIQDKSITKAKLAKRVKINIVNFNLFQPANKEVTLTSGIDGKLHTGVILAEQPFDTEIAFRLDVNEAEIIGKQEIPYQVQFFAHNRDTSEDAYLGDATPGLLSMNKTYYLAKITGIELKRGTYRFQVVAFGKMRNIDPGYIQIPVLRVV